MAEAGSSATQTEPGGQQEASRKRRRSEEVMIRLQAPKQRHVDVPIPRSWLNSEYFEAKLERWSLEDEDAPILLELPAQSDPERGARALRSRLAAAAGKEETWSPIRWWDSTDGEELAFLTSLLLFDLLLLEDISKEVVSAIEAFEVECFDDYETIAKKYSEEVCCRSRWAPIVGAPVKNVSLDSLEGMLSSCLGDDEMGSAMRLMADRIIAGRPKSEVESRKLFDLLMEVYAVSGLGILERTGHNFQGQIRGLQSLGAEITPCIQWLARQIRLVIRRWPHFAKSIVTSITSALASCQPATVKVVDRRGDGVIREDKVYLEYHNDFYPTLATLWIDVVHVLLMEARRAIDDHDRCREVMEGLQATCQVLGGKFESDLYQKFRLPVWQSSGVCSKKLSLPIFAVAPPRAQQLVMRGLDSWASPFLRGHVSLVHPQALHLLIPSITSLSEEDVRYLSTASFPSVEDEKDEI